MRGVKMKKYVCVLSTDNYLEGVLILNENLKFLNSKYELLCLINENISSSTIEILDYFHIEYKKVDSIPYKTINEIHPNWTFSFDKINVMSLTEYEKIVFLDSDILLLKNIDDLFERKAPSMARDYPWKVEKFSSGIMVLEPNINDYTKMKELVAKNDKTGNKIGDQEIYNEFFQNINELERKYDVSRQVLNSKGIYFNSVKNNMESKYCVHEFVKVDDESILLHYCGSLKPFMLDDSFEDDYSDLYHMFHKTVKNKLQELNIEKEYDKYISFINISDINNLDKYNKYIYLYDDKENINKETMIKVINKMEIYNADFCEAVKTGEKDMFWEKELFINNKEYIDIVFNKCEHILHNLDTKIFNKEFLKKACAGVNDYTSEEFVEKLIQEADKVILLDEYIY